MKKNIKKIISIFILISILITSMPVGTIMAYIVRPSIGISSPSRKSINSGETISYTVSYTDVDEMYLSSSHIILNGFTANIYISGRGNTKTITLSNIQGTTGYKNISIRANSARNDAGYAANIPNSVAFYLKNNSDNIRPSIAVSSPSRSSVNAGGSLSYTISFTDNVGVSRINTTSSYITLNGFRANVYVSNMGNKSVVTLSNIQGTSGYKNISIRSGAANDRAGNVTSAIYSTVRFNLVTNNNTATSTKINTNNTSNQTVRNTDKVRPSIAISSPSTSYVYKGGTVSYTVRFEDNIGIERVSLSSAYVALNGFTANVTINNRGLNRIVTLSNIQGSVGRKSIYIKAGAASDSAGNITLASPKTGSFQLVEKQSGMPNKTPTKMVTTNKVVKRNNIANNTRLVIASNIATVKASTVLKSVPKIISSCDDSSEILGNVNKKTTTFSTWLGSKKSITSYTVENNYVAKDEEITYYVDYYNGKESSAKDVKIKLTIPYNVDVEEINADGYIKTQTAEETVIEWDKKTVQSESKCRLYVKVKYLQNVVLENSDKISEQFYVNLKTEYDNKNETSYLRQLFIDKNTNKTATMNKYISALDNTNLIRIDDKITRAELAKLLVDSGVVLVSNKNNDYTKYKDAEEIPTYARDAVSALYSTGIIETFADSEFKPNNPIVRDEFFKIIAKASEYMSGGKLKIKESTFIYKSIIDDKDKTVSDNRNYIMELIRQNILKREDTRPDEYILRKDAIEIINALTFRGPYVEDVPSDTIIFADIGKESKYFYNIIGASNTYTYNYSDTLLQRIIDVK